MGLSPRVRGSHCFDPVEIVHVGSIPARAGEPVPPCFANITCRVYPRACGGASWQEAVERADMGLSPRVRGSLLNLAFGRVRYGSIPARAGEPWIEAHGQACARVYPRACGGAALVFQRMR